MKRLYFNVKYNNIMKIDFTYDPNNECVINKLLYDIVKQKELTVVGFIGTKSRRLS